METTIIKVNPADFAPGNLQAAAELLKKGELVAFPTETVYGLGAVAHNEAALARIFETKGRPGDNPLILHIWHQRQLEMLVTEVDSKYQRLMEVFWPGPLTLVFPKRESVSPLVTAGLPTVAVRMPVHPVARELLRLTDYPVAAPSANRSGRPSPTRGSHVYEDFAGKIPLIIDAGLCNAGIESTVVMLDQNRPVILRPGSITREMLEDTLGETVALSNGEADRPSAPGMKYRHYAPQAPALVVEGPRDKVVTKIDALLKEYAELEKVVVLGFTENLAHYRAKWVFDLGPQDELELAAMRLYDLLRACDELGADRIIIEGVNGGGVGTALKNRLHKASGGNIIDVS